MENTTGSYLQLWFKQGIIKLLTAEQSTILMTILEKITCSKHRESGYDRISVSQFIDATGFCRTTIVSALKLLGELKLIAIGNTNHHGRRYRLLRGPFELSKLQSGERSKVKHKFAAFHHMERQQSIPSTVPCDGTPDRILKLAVAKNTRPFHRMDTPDNITNNKNRYNDFYSAFFKAMQSSSDRIKTCESFFQKTDGAEFDKVNTLYEVLSWMRGAGANDEIEKSWQWHWKIVCRLPRQVIWDGVIQGQLKEGVLLGKITNVGAAYSMAIKKVAAANGIDLETKRGMAKAAPVNKKIRKVA